MKTRTILVAVVALFLTTTAPNPVQAAEAVKLNDTHVLFMIDFSVTASGGAYEVPIAASSRVKYNDRVDIVGYNLGSSNPDTPSIATVSALVLSDTPVSGSRYTVAENDTATFTLAILATFTAPITDDVLASISKLPYWIDGRRTTVHQNQLDELETATLVAQ